MSAEWHYSNGGQQRFGPVPEDQLRALIAQGRVRSEHLVWKNGLASWTRVDASQLRAALPRGGVPTSQAQASQPHARSSNRPWIGIAIAAAVLVAISITAAIVIPLLARKPAPQAASQVPTQPVGAPMSSNSSAAPRQAPVSLSNGASTAGAGVLRIEKRSIVDKNDKLDIDVTYPHTGIAAIDDEIEAWARGEVENIRKAHADPDSPKGSGWSLGIGYTVERNDEKLVAFVFGESSYTGGAHGGSRDITFNYLMPDGYRVDIPHILDAKGLALVSALAIADLKRQSHANDDSLPDEMIENGAGPEWKNFATFTWLPDELHVFFAPYQVGPYASGPQEVHIPLAKLQGLIRADWRAPPPQQVQASLQASPQNPTSQPTANPSPSFDCTKAATFIEKEICRDPTLAKLDSALSRNWTAMNAANIGSAKRDLLVTEKIWLSSRDQCVDNACLRTAYRKRIDAICDYPVLV